MKGEQEEAGKERKGLGEGVTGKNVCGIEGDKEKRGYGNVRREK